MKLAKPLLCLLALGWVGTTADGALAAAPDARLRLAPLFSDHAVLQANRAIPIAGRAKPGARITVTLLRWNASTVAGADGRWTATLPAILPSQAALRLVARSDDGQEASAEDILVGEVWVAGGQSNMEWPLELSEEGYRASTRDALPLVRVFRVEKQVTLAPADEIAGRWVVVAPRQVIDFSAVGYFFARKLQARLGRAVGMIQIAIGGTRIEAWTPADIVAAPTYPEESRTYLASQRAIELARRAAAAWAIEHWAATSPSKGDLLTEEGPVWPAQAADYNIPGGAYDGMMRPAVPFAVTGLLWYQGESNHREGYVYRRKLEAFLDAMARLWGNPRVAIVQTAPFVLADANTPDVWQAQQDVARARGLGFITISDTVDVENIHPRRKQAIGERLAGWALADVYRITGEPYTGPIARSATRRGRMIAVAFDHAEALSARDRDLSGFEWVDAAGVSHPASATLSGATVLLDAPGLAAARQVRYAWSPQARPALQNEAGLPAASFRLPVSTR